MIIISNSYGLSTVDYTSVRAVCAFLCTVSNLLYGKYTTGDKYSQKGYWSWTNSSVINKSSV